MQGFNTRNERKSTPYPSTSSSPATSAEEWLPHRILGVHDTSSIQGRQAPNESHVATSTSHGSKGPLSDQTDLEIYVHPEATEGPTCQPPRQWRGSAGPTGVCPKPRFRRTNLGTADPGPPRGDSSLVQRMILGVRAMLFGPEPWHSPYK